MRQYVVLYEQGPTSWGAEVPDLPGCFAVGQSRDEAEQLIREAMELYVEQLVADGKPVPEPAYVAGTMAVAA